ncbi:unnamed protein product, partial [Chrysoparadoxa australica]
VKHNNVLPNAHFHKKWQRRVKTWFDQPAKKKARRLARAAKAAKIAPRPLELLRPAVRCPTQKYNTKQRLGRGFTPEELKAAGISHKLASTIGICVDKRRVNKSEEGFNVNVDRLKAYKAKLIVFPKKSNQKPKAGDSTAAETGAATQHSGVIMPIVAAEKALEFGAITAEMKAENVYQTLCAARTDAKLVGVRQKMKEDK